MWVAFLGVFAEKCKLGEEGDWLEKVVNTPVESLQLSERVVKAGMLMRKTPLLRVSEVARVAAMLEASQKLPVTQKMVAEFFAQARWIKRWLSADTSECLNGIIAR